MTAVVCVSLSQVRVKEGVRRRQREIEEERERSERKAELWMQKKRQEKFKEETVIDVTVTECKILGGKCLLKT